MASRQQRPTLTQPTRYLGKNGVDGRSLGPWSGKPKKEVKRSTYLHSRLNQKDWQILRAGLFPQTLRLVFLIMWFAFFSCFDVKTWALLETHLPVAAGLEELICWPFLAKCLPLGTPFISSGLHSSLFLERRSSLNLREKHNSLAQWSPLKMLRSFLKYGTPLLAGVTLWFFANWMPFGVFRILLVFVC